MYEGPIELETKVWGTDIIESPKIIFVESLIEKLFRTQNLKIKLDKFIK